MIGVVMRSLGTLVPILLAGCGSSVCDESAAHRAFEALCVRACACGGDCDITWVGRRETVLAQSASECTGAMASFCDDHEDVDWTACEKAAAAAKCVDADGPLVGPEACF